MPQLSSIFVLVIVTIVHCAVVAAANIRALPVLSSGRTEPSNWSIVLTCEGVRVDNGKVAFYTRALCYGDAVKACSMVGPTIEVLPGDNLTLTYVNMLGENGPAEAGEMNTLHSPNTTNLHTHGLHIDPNTDTIFKVAKPGETLVYEYRVVTNHAPGLHWYHAHVHGSTALAVMGGIAGAFIVRPTSQQNVPDSIERGLEYVLVVTGLLAYQERDKRGFVTQGCMEGLTCDPATQPPGCTTENAANSTTYQFWREYTYEELSADSGSTMDSAINVTDPPTDPRIMYFVNGQWQPTVPVPVGGVATLRMVVAHGLGNVNAALNTSTCSLVLIAMDGVYLRARREVSQIVLQSGSRADFQLQCQEAVAAELLFNDEAVLFIMAAEVEDRNMDKTGSRLFEPTTDTELAAIVRPYYLSDHLQSTPDTRFDVFVSTHSRPEEMGCGQWLGAGPDCSGVFPWGSTLPAADLDTCPFRLFAGSRGTNVTAYTEDQLLVTQLGELNEWHIFGPNNANSHTIHLHVNHMQIVNFECIANDCSNGDMENWSDWVTIGEWRDTLPALPGKLTVRFRPTDFTGEAVLHCHHLRHEDLGMMTTVLLTDCNDNTTGKVCSNSCYADSSACDEVVPTLSQSDSAAGEANAGSRPAHAGLVSVTVALTMLAANSILSLGNGGNDPFPSRTHNTQ